MNNTAYSVDGAWGKGEKLPHHRHLLPAIKKMLPADSGLRILDVGCGTGYIAGQIRDMGHEVIGIDFDEAALRIARSKYPSIEFYKHAAESQFTDYIKDADVVMAVEVIEHLYSPKSFLDNVYECLRPGGWVVLSTPYYGYEKNLVISVLNQWDHKFTVGWEEGHIKFFSNRTMRAMLESSHFHSIIFNNAGRFPRLWKSIVARAQK